VREPPITVTCDCEAVAYVPYGARWTCPTCDKTWDTRQIPGDDYARLLSSVRRYRLLAIGPPLVLTAVFIPLAITSGLQYGLLFFVLVFAYAVFVIPKLRKRAAESVRRNARSWELSPE
jgi:predicted cobalt transporter CbtA